MVAAGTVIWISCRPLIRLAFCVACGIGLTKADIFPPVAASGAGQIVLNITLPCLMFSKIVPAFTPQNASALGPLVVVALLYEAMGMAMAFVVRQFFWVPHRFRYGILVAGGWGNVGDIPTAVILSITGGAPFSGVEDQNLAVAYISAFILVFLVTLFPFGGHKLVAWDFVGPDVDSEEVQEAMRVKRRTFFRTLRFRRGSTSPRPDDMRTYSADLEKPTVHEHEGGAPSLHNMPGLENGPAEIYGQGIKSPITSASPTEVGIQTRVGSPVNGVSQCKPHDSPTRGPSPSPVVRAPSTHSSRFIRVPWLRLRIRRRALIDFLKSFLTPPSIAIIVSFPIAFIPKLKALFIEVPGAGIPNAPDGQPPLAFIIDSTNFVGAASVPLGLFCLGSSLARLSFPKREQWKTLPLGAITGIAVGKMLVMPVLGVLICQGLMQAGFIPEEDKVLRLVCIVLSCLPTATVHVLLTQVYSGTGSAEHVSMFLIPQYILMFFSLTATIAFTIQLLF